MAEPADGPFRQFPVSGSGHNAKAAAGESGADDWRVMPRDGVATEQPGQRLKNNALRAPGFHRDERLRFAGHARNNSRNWPSLN
jgi:hypothetical protein